MTNVTSYKSDAKITEETMDDLRALHDVDFRCGKALDETMKDVIIDRNQFFPMTGDQGYEYHSPSYRCNFWPPVA